jgi:membrane-bound ClpP family serine protease
MESVYIIALWLLGIVMVIVGWYVSDAGVFAWLGLATLIFGAALAFRRSHMA